MHLKTNFAFDANFKLYLPFVMDTPPMSGDNRLICGAAVCFKNVLFPCIGRSKNLKYEIARKLVDVHVANVHSYRYHWLVISYLICQTRQKNAISKLMFSKFSRKKISSETYTDWDRWRLAACHESVVLGLCSKLGRIGTGDFGSKLGRACGELKVGSFSLDENHLN